jgi:hypothetical protein
MPGLDTMIRLQAGYNDQNMQAVDQLAQTLGRTFQQQGQRAFQQDAINYFKDGDVSPERIQEFSRQYPGVDPQETWKIASQVATQREAQDVKDAFKTVESLMADNGGKLTPELISGALKGKSPAAVKTMMSLMQQYPDVMKAWKTKVVEGDPTKNRYKEDPVTGEQTLVTPGLREVKKEYKVGEVVPFGGPGGKKFERTVTGHNIDGTATWSDPVDVTNEELVAGPGNKLISKTKGAELYTAPPAQTDMDKEIEARRVVMGLPKGPSSENAVRLILEKEKEKPSWIPYRNSDNGSIKHFDKSNATDRATLEAEGDQWTPLAENPIQNIIRQGVSGATSPSTPTNSKPTTAKTGKTSGIPPGLPPGFIYKGTTGGKKVYSDGVKAWVEP